jgi:hypothetical protein
LANASAGFRGGGVRRGLFPQSADYGRPARHPQLHLSARRSGRWRNGVHHCGEYGCGGVRRNSCHSAGALLHRGHLFLQRQRRKIGIPTPFTVGSNQFATVTLPFAKAGLSGSRGEIQGKVALTIPASTPTPCVLMASMETYDSTTFATHLVLSNPLVNPGTPSSIVVLDPRPGPR